MMGDVAVVDDGVGGEDEGGVGAVLSLLSLPDINTCQLFFQIYKIPRAVNTGKCSDTI